MFAPLASASRAASRARERTRSSIEAAEHLVDQAGPGAEGPEGVLHEIDGLEPSEVEQRLEDEYQPLMSKSAQADQEEDQGQRERGRGHRRDRSEGERSDDVKAKDDHLQLDLSARKFELGLAYGIFFILGACILLAWNSIIVAGVYFGARLKGSKFQDSYSNFVALTFTTGNLSFLAWANVTQHGVSFGLKFGKDGMMMQQGLVLITPLAIEEINPYLFFSVLITTTLVLAASASFLQNAVVALSSKFGPARLQGILSGQGAIGLAVAMIQFVAAYTSFKTEEGEPLMFEAFTSQTRFFKAGKISRRGPVPSAGLRNSAFTFFIAIGAFAFIALLSYLILLRLPLYRLVMRSLGTQDDGERGPNDAAGDSKTPNLKKIEKIEKKVRKYGIAMFFVFGVTLSVFPSITSTIQSCARSSMTESPGRTLTWGCIVHSVNRGPGKDVPLGFTGTLTLPALFIPMSFAMFALGDWIGRIMPQVKVFNFANIKVLMLSSIGRLVFIPLFFMCNTSYSQGTPIINSDVVFLTIMFLFSLSNGYLSTLIMLATVIEPSLDEHEIDTAATCVSFYLTFGLAFGSFASFPVRAIACGCNPFL
ncbi:BZ3500_MvSof-1268-A1-R1_Chr7-1g09240 [Microbotryum saponariae]|uniref:BZ3500_MvSof-1268-A1-R1_Chr7-1g09240 protein n=1 Tax=Microbotryum saponariae TaxID=289078 RepID=A0A2X0MW26_9BASI|nr:BZ3501_MvSof-1269-A2-R1_Chr7-1g08945 [Microbotryum saponariae]SDA03063.1 BZ3500_MvSof-1268-A1-R1_Chr7-1g09240 [Microbotryum saponariae]